MHKPAPVTALWIIKDHMSLAALREWFGWDLTETSWIRKGQALVKFRDARQAAEFFRDNPQAAMPCWRRMEVIGGELFTVR